jgi:arylsulfatase A-like enzyme
MTANILLISLDTVRADHLSVYGYDRNTTPFLEDFAQDCLVYEQAYSASNWTLPSHVSLFTGVSMGKHGVGADATGIRKMVDPRLITLPEYLRAFGYHTSAFTNCGYLSASTHFDRGFEQFRWMEELIGRSHPFYAQQLLGKYWGRILNGIYHRHFYASSDHGAKRTLKKWREWLNHIWKRDQPFFTFLHFFESHAPYRVPAPHRHTFRRITNEDMKLAEAHVNPWHFLTGESPLTKEQFAILRDLYDATLFYQDCIIESIVHTLSDASVMDNTIVILTSDHGESLGEHGSLGHAGDCLFEPVIHVPLLVRIPGREERSRRISYPVSHLDILPTILTLIGHSKSFLDTQIQGKSLLETPQDTLEEQMVLSESLTVPLEKIQRIAPEADLSVFDRYWRAVRWRQYKLIQSSDGAVDLFDLDEDPGETKDLTDTLPDVTQKMMDRVRRWENVTQTVFSDNPFAAKPGDQVVQERLRALGYLE